MNLRIAHVIDSLDPRFGGPPSVCIRLAAAQASLGHQVQIVSLTDHAAIARVAQSLSGVPGIQRVDFAYVEKSTNYWHRMTGSDIERWMLCPDRTWDVVHIHNVWEPAVLGASRAAKRRAIPYVVTPHGTLDRWGMSQGSIKRIKKRIALWLVARAALEGAAFLHMLNEGEREGTSDLGLKVRTEIVPNGVFIEEFLAFPPQVAFREMHPAIGNDPYVIFLSRLHHVKGLDRLIDGFAAMPPRIPRAHLVVAGPDFGVEREMRARVNALGIRDRVHFVGPLYGGDKMAALSGATAYGLVSRQEGFSIALLEALLAGLPVVISAECRFPEVAEFGAGCIVDHDPTSVAEGLSEYLSNPIYARESGLRGRELVALRYTWPALAEMLVNAYVRIEQSSGGDPVAKNNASIGTN